MIALKDSLPLVRFHDGSVMNFERRWLSSALVRAAETAGYKKWWLADHVTESVTSYLEQDFSENVVTISRIEKAVQSVLQVIGYSDVAQHFRTMPAPVRISLAEMARDAGGGYELVFFELLRVRLRGIIFSETQQVELCDLHRCVKFLRSAKNWRRDCSGLRSEIVSFVRGEVDMSHRAQDLQLQLS
ncbi:MAG: hypothetical protein ACOYM3_10550 [Terrimicrobiaceae bacterium]